MNRHFPAKTALKPGRVTAAIRYFKAGHLDVYKNQNLKSKRTCCFVQHFLVCCKNVTRAEWEKSPREEAGAVHLRAASLQFAGGDCSFQGLWSAGSHPHPARRFPPAAGISRAKDSTMETSTQPTQLPRSQRRRLKPGSGRASGRGAESGLTLLSVTI